MKIYHGSKDIVEQPQFGKGKKNNDYGLGFYCTESLFAAKEWSVCSKQDGFVNSYDFDTKNLLLLDLNDSAYCTLHWLSLLLQNRTFVIDSALASTAKAYLLEKFLVNTSNCDYIRGYRADDSYFAFAAAFLEGSISYQELQRAMRLGKLGQQVVIKSPEAFNRLYFIEALPISSEEWYPRRLSRDIKARKDFLNIQNSELQKNGLYIIDILREEMEPGDARL